MKLIGLTGGVGMGKSTSADFLARSEIPVVDTDVLARDVVEPGQPALAAIEERFGAEVIDDAGQLRRDLLARVVFADEQKRRELEGILHPRIREQWLRQVAEWRGQGHQFAVVVIPLLFETHAEDEFDFVICTACSAATQRRRLSQRGWDAVSIEQRVRAQWPIQTKMLQAHYVVWTEPPLDVHAAQLDRILRLHGASLQRNA